MSYRYPSQSSLLPPNGKVSPPPTFPDASTVLIEPHIKKICITGNVIAAAGLTNLRHEIWGRRYTPASQDLELIATFAGLEAFAGGSIVPYVFDIDNGGGCKYSAITVVHLADVGDPDTATDGFQVNKA